MKINQKIVNYPKMAYFIGYFLADGSFYNDGRSTRFEFSDGTSIQNELYFSKQFMKNIRKIIEDLFEIKIKSFRKRGNKFVMAFRSIKVDKFFRNEFNFKPGVKTYSCDIPKQYKNNNLEKYFWLGVMDGDGMVARNNRKVALGLSNYNIINSFCDFLNRNGIKFSLTKRKLINICYTVTINSYYFKDYCSKIGFLHPRKALWINNHLKKSDFYINNIINIDGICIDNNIIDYEKIFDRNVYVVNGKITLKKYGYKICGRKNIPFVKWFDFLMKQGISKDKIYLILNKHKLKLSKGSTNSIKLPLFLSENLLLLANFVRLRQGNIGFSRLYIKTKGHNPHDVIDKIKEIFDIQEKYTIRNEPIFCSGVLEQFFAKIIKTQQKSYIIPKWQKKII